MLPAAEDLVALYEKKSSLVCRECLDKSFLGWRGCVVEASTREIMTMYPGGEDQTAFSREKCHHDRAAIKPSLKFYEWMIAAKGRPWQIRGTLTGLDLSSAVEKDFLDKVEIESTSLWAGAGNTRTPLHSDDIHALIFQIAGTKRFLLRSRDSVRLEANRGNLPREVLSAGTTESFCVDGSQKEIFGEEDTYILKEGDALVLPAGVYHDVECDLEPAVSLTVRFELRTSPKQGDHDPTSNDALRRLLLRYASRKAGEALKEDETLSTGKRECL